MTISASELRLHKKLNSDSSTYVVYVPSVVELLDQNGVYNNGNLPLPYIMTISKAVDIQLEYETMFWGKSIDAITQRLKLISRKKQLWSICLYGTNNFSGIANKKEIAALEDTGFESYLVRSNSRWTHNYNDLWRYIMASLRFGDWGYHNAYHNVPDGFVTDYTNVYDAILKIPEFTEKQIDKERHEAIIKKFYSFADKYDEKLTVLMLRVRAKNASSKLRSELIDGRLDANRLDRIWLDIRKAMKVYGVRYGLYNNETKILHSIIKKFEIPFS